MSKPRLVLSYHDDVSKGAKRDTFEQKLEKSVDVYKKKTGVAAKSCLINQGVFERMFRTEGGDIPTSFVLNGITIEGRQWVLRADMHIGDLP